MRPSDQIRAFCARGAPPLGLEHRVEADQAGRKGVHLGAHGDNAAEKDCQSLNWASKPTLVVEAGRVSMLMVCLVCLLPVVMPKRACT